MILLDMTGCPTPNDKPVVMDYRDPSGTPHDTDDRPFDGWGPLNPAGVAVAPVAQMRGSVATHGGAWVAESANTADGSVAGGAGGTDRATVGFLGGIAGLRTDVQVTLGM